MCDACQQKGGLQTSYDVLHSDVGLLSIMKENPKPSYSVTPG